MATPGASQPEGGCSGGEGQERNAGNGSPIDPFEEGTETCRVNGRPILRPIARAKPHRVAPVRTNSVTAAVTEIDRCAAPSAATRTAAPRRLEALEPGGHHRSPIPARPTQHRRAGARERRAEGRKIAQTRSSPRPAAAPAALGRARAGGRRARPRSAPADRCSIAATSSAARARGVHGVEQWHLRRDGRPRLLGGELVRRDHRHELDRRRAERHGSAGRAADFHESMTPPDRAAATLSGCPSSSTASVNGSPLVALPGLSRQHPSGDRGSARPEAAGERHRVGHVKRRVPRDRRRRRRTPARTGCRRRAGASRRLPPPRRRPARRVTADRRGSRPCCAAPAPPPGNRTPAPGWPMTPER